MVVVEVKLAATGKVGVNNKYAEDSFVTPINLSWEKAQEYYAIGKIFNMGLWYDSAMKEHEDNLMRVTEVRLISEN